MATNIGAGCGRLSRGWVALAAVALFVPASPAKGQAPAGTGVAAEIANQLQALVDSVATDPEIPGALLYAGSPTLELDWQGSSGVLDSLSGAPMPPSSPVRNASNTKTYVAAAVLRLWEMGQLDLDQSIRAYLSADQAELLAGDGYDLDAITLRLLLTHTAGLVDHGSADEYATAIMSDPYRRWTRDDQLAGAVDWGDPLSSPGTAYSYSDTGYILLGQVIERVTGDPLGPAVRALVGFDRLGLGSTWWELMEDPPAGAGTRAHQYILGADTYEWDPSLDSYGGGGLATSTRDLAVFWQALFDGRVFDHEATLDTMLTSPLPPEETPYRMGIFVLDLDGLRGFGHSGFWGTRAIYVPELDLVVSGAVTEQSRGRAVFRMLDQAVRIVRQPSEARSGAGRAGPTSW